MVALKLFALPFLIMGTLYLKFLKYCVGVGSVIVWAFLALVSLGDSDKFNRLLDSQNTNKASLVIGFGISLIIITTLIKVIILLIWKMW